MSLEQEWYKTEGRYIQDTGTRRDSRPSGLDYFTRVVAWIILVGFASFSIWALGFIPFGNLVMTAIIVLVIVYLLSRVRELRLKLEALESRTPTNEDSKRESEPERAQPDATPPSP